MIKDLTQYEIREMDLARMLGMGLYEMKERLTEDEVHMWFRYMELNPPYSTDIQLAQLSMMVAAFMGDKNANFDNFYVHKQPEKPKPKVEEPETKEREVGYELDNLVRNAYR